MAEYYKSCVADWISDLQEVAKLEAEKAQLMQQKEAVFSGREVLQEKVIQLRQEVESAAAAIDQAENQLVDLVKEVRTIATPAACFVDGLSDSSLHLLYITNSKD